MLKEIELKNFRGIKSCKIASLNQINLFIGKFGSGKSTILESIYMLKMLSPIGIGGIARQILTRRTDRGTRRGPEETPIDSSSLIYRYAQEETSMIEIKFEDSWLKIEMGSPRKLDTPGAGEPGYQFGFKISYGLASGQVFENWSIASFGWNLSSPVSGRIITPSPIHPDFVSDMVLIDEHYKREVQTVESSYLDPIKRRPPMDADFIHNIVGWAFDDIKGYEFMRYSPRMQESRSSFAFSDARVFIDEIADGARDGIAILATAYLSKNTALLIEEPEDHIHARSLGAMISKLVDFASKNDLQLFVTTHRPEVVAHFVEFGKEKVNVFHVERQNGETRAFPTEWYDVKILMDIGCDAGLLAKGFERYVITEGLIDKSIIESYIKKLKNQDPEDLWVTVISCRGKDNLKEIVKALIPTGKTMFILRDRNGRTAEDTIASVIDSVKSLEKEGYKIEENESVIRLLKDPIVCEIRKDHVLALGQEIEIDGIKEGFKKHTIDDYILDMIAKDKELREKLGVNKEDLSKYIAASNDSKSVLLRIFDYGPETAEEIIKVSRVLSDPLAKITESIFE